MNGEERELLVDADNVSEHEGCMYFYKDKRAVATAPSERVLYAVEVKK